VIFRHTVTGAGLGTKQCGAVLKSAGAGRSGQDFSNSCGCGAGADKNFQPAQDSRLGVGK